MDKIFAQHGRNAAPNRPVNPEQEQRSDAVASTSGTGADAKKLPKGVVLGKDGKPYALSSPLPPPLSFSY